VYELACVFLSFLHTASSSTKVPWLSLPRPLRTNYAFLASSIRTVVEKQSQQNYRPIYWHAKRPISSPETIGNWLYLTNGTSQFPKSKDSSEKRSKIWRGPKKIDKILKNSFLNEYCPIPPKKNKVIFSSPRKIIPSMPPKPRGRPPKKHRNLTDSKMLRNRGLHLEYYEWTVVGLFFVELCTSAFILLMGITRLFTW
jgi:hypothetical protein